jgi:hypothetical protein
MDDEGWEARMAARARARRAAREAAERAARMEELRDEPGLVWSVDELRAADPDACGTCYEPRQERWGWWYYLRVCGGCDHAHHANEIPIAA